MAVRAHHRAESTAQLGRNLLLLPGFTIVSLNTVRKPGIRRPASGPLFRRAEIEEAFRGTEDRAEDRASGNAFDAVRLVRRAVPRSAPIQFLVGTPVGRIDQEPSGEHDKVFSIR